MSMKANITRDSQGNILVQMEGGIDYKTSLPLREELLSLAAHHPESGLQIDMAGIDFVGSSGIGHFVETLKILKSEKNQLIQLNNVDSDFKHIFKLYGLNSSIVMISNFELDTVEPEAFNTRFGNRRRTFEN